MKEDVNEVLAGAIEGVASRNNAEKTLNILANVVLICGILASVVCLFSMIGGERVFNPSGLATTLLIFFSSLISCCLMKVLANISLTLKEINKKLK